MKSRYFEIVFLVFCLLMLGTYYALGADYKSMGTDYLISIHQGSFDSVRDEKVQDRLITVGFAPNLMNGAETPKDIQALASDLRKLLEEERLMQINF